MSSSRVAWDLTPNPLSRLRAQKEAAGVALLDLTVANPTQVGLPLPDDLLAPLADPRALVYEPSPRGLPDARAAVARYYEGRGHAVDPDRLILTASSSEAYAFLFKLLASPGDEVLVPSPSYPLFEYLAGLDLVATTAYALDPTRGWRIDLDELEQLIVPTSPAVVVVNPNNPTGTFLKRDEREALVGLLAERGLALISDEVFADYPAGADPQRVDSLVEEARVPTFCLGGFSKLLGLPQLKLGWICVNGPAAWLADALQRLALIADTYLSVNTPVQHAAAPLLARLPELHGRIARRVAASRAFLAGLAAPRVHLGEGGWCAWFELPGPRSDEEWALHLLEAHDVLVHPGYFFGSEFERMAVISLLTPEERLREGMERVGKALVGG